MSTILMTATPGAEDRDVCITNSEFTGSEHWAVAEQTNTWLLLRSVIRPFGKTCKL